MTTPEIPLARRSSSTSTFLSAQHGTVEVPNPYDWLEDNSSGETAAFISAQNAAFASYLDDASLGPAKQRLTQSLMDMWKLTIFPSVPQNLGAGDGEYIVRVMGRGREFAVSYRMSKSAVLGGDLTTTAAAAAAAQSGPQTGFEKPTIFYDEATYASVLTASSLSPSGDFWAFTTSDAGSDWGIIRIKDVRTGEMLPDEVRGTKFASKPCSTVPWLGDRGFFYTFYPGGGPRGNDGSTTVAKPAPAQLRFHAVGTAQEDDEVVYEDARHPGYSFKASVSTDARVVFLEVYDQSRGCQVWAAQVDGDEVNGSADAAAAATSENRKLNLKFDELVSDSFEAEFEYIGSSRTPSNSHFFWTSASNGKVVAYQDKSLHDVIAPRDRETLKLARLLSNGTILAVRSVDVRDQIQIFSSRTGELLKTVVGGEDGLPMWTILDASFDAETETLFLLESAFTHPPRLWHTRVSASNADAGDKTNIAMSLSLSPFRLVSLFPEASLPTSPSAVPAPAPASPPTLSTTQIFYPSTDSTQIPMFLTRLSRSSSSAPSPTGPILLYIYGAFGLSVIPHFRPDFVTFLHVFAGSTLAVANIRGGGEYGTAWHEGALKGHRQRLFDDVACAAQHLRRHDDDDDDVLGSSTKTKLILMGESMGGLNAASVMAQHPELFDAVVLNAGVLDVLHRQRLVGTDRGVGEIGDVHDAKEFDFIKSWAPLERVLSSTAGLRDPDVEGGDAREVEYPPVLLTAGDQDDLVPPAHSLKMAAALQHHSQQHVGAAGQSTESAAATHVRIIKNLGHGGNISAKAKAAVGVERWLWVKKTLGLEIN